MKHWNSDPARVELASADRQSAVLADERWILNGDWGRTRTYVVSNVADLQSAAFATRRHPTIGTSVESRTPLHSMKSYCPTARRQRHLLKRIFYTSTYHLTASSWLLVDLAVILFCCCIGVASDHTLLCRKINLKIKMVGGEVIETPSAAYKTAVINQYTNRP